MAYDTNNPVGSTDPRDLYDNAGNLDKFVNGDQPFYPDRLGKQRLSYSGMEQDFQSSQEGRDAEFQQFLTASGFSWLGDYAAGITFTNRSQYMTRDNLSYRLALGTTIPYLTTGNWALEQAKFLIFPNEDVLRQDLARTTGSALVGFSADGASTTARTAQEKLRDVASRADYSTDAAFNAAKAGKVSIDGSGNLGGSVVPTGSTSAIALADIARDAKNSGLMQYPTGSRPVVRYGSATSVRVSNNYVVMGEFRFMGSYTGGRARVLPMGTKVASLAVAGLGAESSVRPENWYGAFAVSNPVDSSATIKTMPFLRVASVAGLVVSLNKAGEGIHTVQAQTYSWAGVNNLSGVKCLVISEAGNFTGRVATITENKPGSVTLDSVGALAFGDFLLPAPPGFTEFCYLATFYNDTAEVRNIYDTGSEVVSKGIYILSPETAGAQTNASINCAGYISPLASGVRLDSLCLMSTASGGDYAEYFSPDSGNHTVRTNYDYKDNSSSRSFVFGGVSLAFLYAQTFCITTAGTLKGSRSGGQITPTGWFEP